MHTFESFCACYVKNGYKVPDMPVLGNRSKDNGGIHTDGTFWHPGFAWAARREAIEALGGVMEFPILGSADHLMSLAFVGQSERINDLRLSPEYLNSVKAWEVKALKHVNFDIGYVPGTIFHYFHGKKVNRGYNTRTGILVESQFNPYTDIKKDVAGVIHLVVEDERQRRLRDDLRAYFRARNEDGQD